LAQKSKDGQMTEYEKRSIDLLEQIAADIRSLRELAEAQEREKKENQRAIAEMGRRHFGLSQE
jgi:predicted transcriptional regulator